MKDQIEELKKEIKSCRHDCRKQNNTVLFGRSLSYEAGDSIDLLFLGIAPQPGTYDSREQREIFGWYSPTGKRIQSMILELRSIIPDISCWGTNCVKCNIRENEIMNAMYNCYKYLTKEIEILNPKLIVLLGKSTVENFLEEEFIVGRVSKRYGISCMHYYHPMERTGRFMKHKKLLINFLKSYRMKTNLGDMKISNEQITQANATIVCKKIESAKPEIVKYKHFTLDGLASGKGKRNMLFNAIKKEAMNLSQGQSITKTIRELIGEIFVAKGLANKIRYDLFKGDRISLKIEEDGLKEYIGSRYHSSPRPTKLKITKLQ